MTKLPQSTISFNTADFLKSVLDSMIKDGKLQSYIYIVHQAEEDTKKDHIHLLAIPAKTINPVKFRKEFSEPCLNGLDLGCLPFKTSKLNDWLLYAMHYPPYLISKGLQRVYNYTLEDFVSNEPHEFIDQCFSDACESLVNVRINTFLDHIKNGSSFGATLAEGLVPPSQVIFYEKLFKTYARKCNTNFSPV